MNSAHLPIYEAQNSIHGMILPWMSTGTDALRGARGAAKLAFNWRKIGTPWTRKMDGFHMIIMISPSKSIELWDLSE